MNAGGGLFADAFPISDNMTPETGALLGDALEEVLDHRFLLRAAGRVDPWVAFFQLIAFVDQQGGVAAVIDNQLRALAAGMAEGGERAVPIFLQRFAFPGKDGDAGLGHGGGSVILSGENVATGPTHRSAEINQSLNENGGLDVMCKEPVMRTPWSGLPGA